MGLVQSQPKPKSRLTKVPVGAKNIKFGRKWVENRRFGLKLGPEACQDRSGAFGGGLTPLQGAVPGLVLEFQVGSAVSVRAHIIENGPKWVEDRRFGPKQRPNEPNRLSGPIRTTPEAKNVQKSDFLTKTAPRGPRRPPSPYRSND